MAGVLDLYSTELGHAAAAAARAPVIGLSPSMSEAYVAARRAIAAQQSALFEARIRAEVVNEALAPYRAATGRDLTNPTYLEPPMAWGDMGAPDFGDPRPVRPTPPTVGVENIPGATNEWGGLTPGMLAIDEVYNQWARENGQALFPTRDELDRRVLSRRQAVFQESQEVLSASRTGGAGLGNLLGGMVGSLADPIVAGSLFFGAGWASGVIRTALIEMGIGAGSELVSVMANLDAIREVDPTFGPEQIFERVAFAAGGGAIIGGGIKFIARTFNLLRGLRGTHGLSQQVRDAGAIVEREATANPPPPPQATAERVRAQREATAQATLDLGADRPVTVPPAAAASAAARTGRVYDAAGTGIDVQYEVVPLASLTASNFPDFRVNPAYPAALQPRDRTRAVNQAQVADIAANLNPARLGVSTDAASGAPIVSTTGGIVESGNGRVLAIGRAYEAGGEAAARYQAHLRELGYDVTAIEQPVLVARRLTALDEPGRVKFVNAANQSQVMRLSAGEQALADARLLDRDLLDQLTEGGVTAASNRAFVRGFMDRLPAGERGALIDKEGNLSQAGLRRVQAALMGRAYGDAVLLGRILEDTDNNIRALGGALEDAAGAWAQMVDAVARGDIPNGMNISRDLLDAVQAIMRARDAKVPVRKFFDQGDLYGGISQNAKLLLRGMFNNDEMTRPAARSRVAAMLRGYAVEAQKNLDAADSLFGAAPLTSGEILSRPLAAIDRADLAAEAAARTTPEAAAKLVDDPAVDEAIIQAAVDLSMAPNIVRTDGVKRTVKVFRGVSSDRDPAGTADTTAGARFLSPDRKVAENYAGVGGRVSEETVTFNNLLEAENWFEAKTMLGLPKSGTMQDLIEAARAAGHDGLSFKTTNGVEYIQIPPALRTGSLRTTPVSRGFNAQGEEIFEDVPLERALAEADEEIAAAAQIEACAVGKPLEEAAA